MIRGPNPEIAETAGIAFGQSRPGDSCVECHGNSGDGVTVLYARSTHSRRRIACSQCHQGDARESTKDKAHSNRFLGRPNPADVVTMCGSCHTAQLATFKTGRHYDHRKMSPRVDCVQCHGAHTVGAQARSFSLSYFCSGCHGLEYLPKLPELLGNVVEQTDKIREFLMELQLAGKRPSDEAMSIRREVRGLTAELVHSTVAGEAKLAEILKKGDSFLNRVRQEGR
jgi:hypothetical protein